MNARASQYIQTKLAQIKEKVREVKTDDEMIEMLREALEDVYYCGWSDAIDRERGRAPAE